MGIGINLATSLTTPEGSYRPKVVIYLQLVHISKAPGAPDISGFLTRSQDAPYASGWLEKSSYLDNYKVGNDCSWT